MKNYFLIFTLVSFTLACDPPHPDCLHGEPYLNISFFDKVTGAYLDTNAMSKISIHGAGLPTIVNYGSHYYNVPSPHSNNIYVPLNINADSCMFIIQNNTITDTLVFHYVRGNEYIKRNCNHKKGEYVVTAKNLGISYTSLDSISISNSYNYYLNENYSAYIYY